MNNQKSDNKESNEEGQEIKFRKIFLFVAGTLIVILTIIIFWIIVKRGFEDKVWLPIAMQHFPSIVGLPMAAIASLMVVMLLKYTSGPIEFEILSLKFKGASGQIVFWILCFLSIVLAIKILWPLEINLESVKVLQHQLKE